ncbi:DUF1345 domain-containing protein [Actinospica robiniae]|uniref:Putative membrane protein n=1 Tax=Actinospica robiniae DSM 44927 TaxID=479430 RepID=W9DWC6_9ACTN|nr:DUF1345 domain-containing protein [Actinospica robiniae]ETA71129.1 putative membrane protein [Actinospica robiniae DSM 44927]
MLVSGVCQAYAVTPTSSAPSRATRQPRASARIQFVGSAIAGLFVGVASAVLGAEKVAALIGWDAMALVFGVWVWAAVWPLDPATTAKHAKSEDPGRGQADLVLLSAAVASLAGVGVVVFGAGHAHGAAQYSLAGLALFSVFVSWMLTHTIFALKYARLYYSSGAVGGISFNEDDDPQYSDFAYLAFTIGMTFQVSDTDIQAKQIRRTALRQALLSYPLGAVVIAATINLLSGLAK